MSASNFKNYSQEENIQKDKTLYSPRGFFYSISFIPPLLISVGIFINLFKKSVFLCGNNFSFSIFKDINKLQILLYNFPSFAEIASTSPEKRFVTVCLNSCGWLMLPVYIITNKIVQAVYIPQKSRFSHSKKLFLILLEAISFFSVILFGSFDPSHSRTINRVSSISFLTSLTIYFTTINAIIKDFDPKRLTFFDWLHAIAGPILFVLLYLFALFNVVNSTLIILSKILQRI